MLEALSINIFSAANDASPAPPLEAPLQSTDLFANGWATTATDPAAAAAAATATTTAAMEPEDNNYTYVLHMAASHNIVACAGSNNLIRIYDVSQPRRQAPLLATLNPAKPAGNSPVTGVVFVENALISCSESGRLFLWDLRAPATPAAKFSCPPAGGGDTSCVCVRGDGKVVAAGVGSSLRLWDVGTRKVMTTYEEAHTDDVTMVKFHPTVSNRLISGSLDGLICVTDTSISPTPDTDEDEGDTLVSVLSVEHPINYFDFTDQQAKTIGVITCDEEFSVWSLESASVIKTYNDTRTRLTTPAYAAEHFVGCHYDPSIGPVLLSTNTSGAFALHSVAQDLQTIAHAQGSQAAGHIGEVRSYAMAGSVLVTGGEDARVCTWGPKGAAAAATATTTTHMMQQTGPMVSTMTQIFPQTQRGGAIRNEKKYKKLNKSPYEK